MPVDEGPIDVPAGVGRRRRRRRRLADLADRAVVDAALAIGMALLAGSELVRSRRRTVAV